MRRMNNRMGNAHRPRVADFEVGFALYRTIDALRPQDASSVSRLIATRGSSFLADTRVGKGMVGGEQDVNENASCR